MGRHLSVKEVVERYSRKIGTGQAKAWSQGRLITK